MRMFLQKIFLSSFLFITKHSYIPWVFSRAPVRVKAVGDPPSQPASGPLHNVGNRGRSGHHSSGHRVASSLRRQLWTFEYLYHILLKKCSE